MQNQFYVMLKLWCLFVHVHMCILFIYGYLLYNRVLINMPFMRVYIFCMYKCIYGFLPGM